MPADRSISALTLTLALAPALAGAALLGGCAAGHDHPHDEGAAGAPAEGAGEVAYEPAFPAEVSDEPLTEADRAAQGAVHSHGGEAHAHGEGEAPPAHEDEPHGHEDGDDHDH